MYGYAYIYYVLKILLFGFLLHTLYLKTRLKKSLIRFANETITLFRRSKDPFAFDEAAALHGSAEPT